MPLETSTSGSVSEIKGMDELNRLLEEIGPRLRNKHLRNGVSKAIRVTRDDIKATAPIRDTGQRTYRKGATRPKPGRLRRLVRVKLRRVKRTYVKAQLFYPTEGEGNDPKNAFYWRFLEDGTKNMPPHPFILPAVDRTFNRVVRVMTGETSAGIRAEIKKLGHQE